MIIRHFFLFGLILLLIFSCKNELPEKLNTNLVDSEYELEGAVINVLNTELFYEKSTNNEISSIHIIQTIKADERFFENGNPGKPIKNLTIEVWINDVKSNYVVRNGNKVVYFGRPQIKGTTVNMKIKSVVASQNVLHTAESLVFIP